MAQLIALEGIDGSGKGTQAKRLYEKLLAAGRRAELISFPRYDATLFGRAIGQFLNGRFGSLDAVNPFLVSLLYAGDRFESRAFLRDALANNDVVVLDRYVPSNIAHQAAKLTSEERRELIDWIERIEYGLYELPKADLVLLLDLPAVEARKLIAKKSARSYTNQAADLQESDTDYLEAVRQVYREQAASNPTTWRTIECFDGGEVRSVDDIGEEIWRVVNSA